MNDRTQLYGNRDVIALDDAGGYFRKHMSAMTGENLHRKCDIAAELAFRDSVIEQPTPPRANYEPTTDH